MSPRASALGLIVALSLGACSDDANGGPGAVKNDCAEGQIKIVADIQDIGPYPGRETGVFAPLLGHDLGVSACLGPLTDQDADPASYKGASQPNTGSATLSGADLGLAPEGFADALKTIAYSSFDIGEIDPDYKEMRVIISMRAQPEASLWEINLRCVTITAEPADAADPAPMTAECKPGTQYGGEAWLMLDGGLGAMVSGSVSFQIVM